MTKFYGSWNYRHGISLWPSIDFTRKINHSKLLSFEIGYLNCTLRVHVMMCSMFGI